MKGKKLLASALSAAMVLGTMVMPVFAAELTANTFDELKNRISNANDGDTIKLGADIKKEAYARDYDFEPNVKLIFDLDGHTLSLNGDNLFDCDTTFKNGTINLGPKTSTAFIWMYDGADLELNDITLNAQSTSGYALICSDAEQNVSIGDIRIIDSRINVTDPNNSEGNDPSIVYSAENIDIVNSQITATEAQRGFVNVINLNLDRNSSLTMNKCTEAVFRNVGGTISGKLDVDKCKNGIKNTAGQELVFDENAVVTIKNCTDVSIILEGDATIVSSSENVEIDDDGINAITTPVAKIGDKCYKTLADAIIATKTMSEDDITIDCVPNADLGHVFQVGVTKNLTINGNGAYISSGNGTLSFDMPTHDATQNGDCTLEHDITVVVNDVKGIGAWGTRNTDYTVNLEFNNCKDMFEVYLNGAKGTNNYKLNNCSFDKTGTGKASSVSVFSNTNGTIEIENTEFNGVTEPIKLNNKKTDEIKLTVRNSTFKNCSVTDGTYQSYEAERSPIGVMTSGDGASANITVEDCDFVYDGSNTPANGQIRIGTAETGKTSTPYVTATINNNKSDVKVNTLYTDGTAAKTTTVSANTGATVTNAVTADTISLKFVQDSTDNTVYDIVLSGEGKNINRLNAAKFKFDLSNSAMTYEIKSADRLTTLNPDVDEYLFYFDGKDVIGTADSGAEITIGAVKFDGYGDFTFKATDGKVTATTTADNLVSEFVTGGAADKGTLKIENSDNMITDSFDIPTQELTINVLMNHKVNANAADYQDMTVAISGGDLKGKVLTYKLGNADTVIDETTKTVNAQVNGSYQIKEKLTQNRLYTVTVSGAGYRTARYTVTMSEDKTMNVWNNVMTNEITVVDDTKATTSFLAGEIVKDGIINIYDLSAVVAYFGKTMDTSAYDKFAKYDLNRDGNIDMMDISIVLTSWGN